MKELFSREMKKNKGLNLQNGESLAKQSLLKLLPLNLEVVQRLAMRSP